MRLSDLLHQRKPRILDRWFDLIVETYPTETSRLLKSEDDRFANPVGHTVKREIDLLFDLILKDADKDDFIPPLENIVKIRAVQDFSPSEGIRFVFLLKRAVSEELKNELGGEGLLRELREFDSRVEDVALIAFDIYVDCCRRIYEVRAQEVKSRTYMLLRKANLIV
jgi:hypothetical protein